MVFLLWVFSNWNCFNDFVFLAINNWKCITVHIYYKRSRPILCKRMTVRRDSWIYVFNYSNLCQIYYRNWTPKISNIRYSSFRRPCLYIFWARSNLYFIFYCIVFMTSTLPPYTSPTYRISLNSATPCTSTSVSVYHCYN